MKNLALLALALFAFGCGADKTVKDFQNEETQKKKAELEAISGSYTGLVNSTFDGQVLGAMQLDLSVKIIPSPDNSGTPVVSANVHFLDNTEMNLTTENSFYDPATGTFSARIVIAREASPSEVVNLSGNLNGSIFAGTIASARYPNSGGSLRLNKDGRNLSELLKEARPGWRGGDSAAREVSVYSGTTTFTAGPKKAIRLVILQPLRNTPEDFLELIYPVKVVQASLNFGQSLHLLFNNAIFDTVQGLLTGEMVLQNNSTQRMTMQCNLSEGQEITCRHVTTGSGVIAHTTGRLATGPIQDPPETPDDRDSVTKRFVGKGKHLGRTKDMEFTVTRPVRSRLTDLLELFFPTQEKLVNASIVFDEKLGTSASFTDAKWDTETGSLDGQFAGLNYTAYLRCQNFYFTSSRTTFSCDYWTSRSAVITITFKPPFNR